MKFVEIEGLSWYNPPQVVQVMSLMQDSNPQCPPNTQHQVEDRLFGSSLALGLSDLVTAELDALQDALAVLVELQLGDDDVAGVDAEGNAGTGSLVTGDALDVDDIFETVDRGHLALLVLVGTADDRNLIILADGDAANVVLLTELLAERGAHDVAADARRSTEVRLARLAPRGVEGCADLSHCD